MFCHQHLCDQAKNSSTFDFFRYLSARILFFYWYSCSIIWVLCGFFFFLLFKKIKKRCIQLNVYAIANGFFFSFKMCFEWNPSTAFGQGWMILGEETLSNISILQVWMGKLKMTAGYELLILLELFICIMVKLFTALNG